MEQKKKVCKLAFVHNALVLLFLVWVLFMPWEEAGSAFYYHRVLFSPISRAAERSYSGYSNGFF